MCADKMKIKERKLKGVFEISFKPHEDKRGFFMRTYDERLFKKNGLHHRWVQENHSYSRKRGTLRGLHFQFPPYAETKVIWVITGKIFLVFVDLRRGSLTFGQWESVTLRADDKKMMYIPAGFAFGMRTLTDNVILLYKMGTHYVPKSQGVIRWDDPDLGIDWPAGKPILSERDAKAQSFKEFKARFKGLEV